jgi:hypothetical protein
VPFIIKTELETHTERERERERERDCYGMNRGTVCPCMVRVLKLSQTEEDDVSHSLTVT